MKVIGERLRDVQSHQKSYVDVRRKYIESEEGKWVYLKVSPMTGVM